MKKTVKKLLALILTLTMLASTFAMATLTADAATTYRSYSETFDNYALDANGQHKSGDILLNYKHLPLGGEAKTEIVNDPAGGTNKVLKLTAKGGSEVGFSMRIFDSTKNVVTFDFYHEYYDATSTALGMGIKYIPCCAQQTTFFAQFRTSYTSFIQANGYVGTKGTDILSNDVWYSAKMERNGNTIRALIYERENPSEIKYDYSYTFTNDITTVVSATNDYCRIVLAKAGGTAQGKVYIDNITYDDLPDAPTVAGMQASDIDATENTYAVRCIGSVNVPTEKYTKLGFEVKATYADGAKSKTFKLEGSTVYSSLLASANGITYVVEAGELGGDALIALNIVDIPKDAGVVTFEVTAFGYAAQGAKVVSDTVTYTATPGDTTVTLAKPAV